MLNLSLFRRKKVRLKNRFKEFRYRNLLNFMKYANKNFSKINLLLKQGFGVPVISKGQLITQTLKYDAKLAIADFLEKEYNETENIMQFTITNRRQLYLFFSYKDLEISLSSGAVLMYLGFEKKSLKYVKNNLLIILNLIKKSKKIELDNDGLKVILNIKYWNTNTKFIINSFLGWKFKNIKKKLKFFLLENKINFSKNKFKGVRSLKKRLKKKIVKLG